MRKAMRPAARGRDDETTPQHVAAYIRVSTDKQAKSGLGLADQRQRIRAMAQVKGWPEPCEYTDEGISGAKESTKRPALASLLADVRAGQVDALIINSLDRLARNVRLTLEIVETLRAADVSLVSCKESLDTDTAAGQMIMTILAAMAEFERGLARERTIAALDELERTGRDTGGRLPYGYVRTARGFAVDAPAARVVRRIFTLHGRGESQRAIAAALHDRAVPSPRGKSWHHTGVGEILRNEAAYRGGPRGTGGLRWPVLLSTPGHANLP